MNHAAESLTLRAGSLRFSATSMGEGPLVLCLHGFPDHARSFRHQQPALAAAGYRAVAPTLRGYEPSSQPADRRYYLIDLAEDLIAWLDDLGVEQTHIVGHDWGAMIAYTAAALAPERIASMVTIAVPHIRRFLPALGQLFPAQLRRSWYVLFFQLRGLSDLYVHRDWAVVDKLWRDWSPGWSPEPGELEAVKQTLSQPGVRRAMVAYYRAMFGSPTPRSWASWKLFTAKIQVPTLSLTGARDGAVDSYLTDFGDWREDFLGPAEMQRFEDAGHFVHQELPEAVNAAILDWLQAYPIHEGA